MDCSPPGSSVHGIFQARVLEWGAIECVKYICGLPEAQQSIVCLQCRRRRRRRWHPTPLLLPGKPQDGEAWKAAVHGVAEGRTRLSNFTFTFHFPYLLISYPYDAFSPFLYLVTTSLFSISVNLFLFCYSHSLVLFFSFHV